MYALHHGRIMYNLILINLDHQKERLRVMMDQCAALDISPIRLSAVNGRAPGARARAHAAPYAPLTDGEVGCFESHIKAWKMVVENGLDGAFVAEDDMIFASDLGQMKFPADLLQRADIIKIDQSLPRESIYGTQAIPVAGSAGRSVVRMLGSEMSTGCYFITRKGAQTLLARAQNYILPVDVFMFDRESKVFWDLEVWKLRDAAAAQILMLTEAAGLHADFQDRIQGAPRPEQARGLPARWRHTRLRLRRVMDLDTRHRRVQRANTNLTRFAATRPVEQRQITFSSPGTAHVRMLLPQSMQPDPHAS